MRSNLIGESAKVKVLNYSHPIRTERNHLYFVEEVRFQLKKLPCNITEELYVTNSTNSEAFVIFKTDFYEDDDYALSIILQNSMTPSKGVTITTGFCNKTPNSYALYFSNVIYKQTHNSGKYLVRRSINSSLVADMMSEVDWFTAFYDCIEKYKVMGNENLHKYLLMKFKNKCISAAMFDNLLRKSVTGEMSTMDVINYINDYSTKKKMNIDELHVHQKYAEGYLTGLILA